MRIILQWPESFITWALWTFAQKTKLYPLFLTGPHFRFLITQRKTHHIGTDTIRQYDIPQLYFVCWCHHFEARHWPDTPEIWRHLIQFIKIVKFIEYKNTVFVDIDIIAGPITYIVNITLTTEIFLTEFKCTNVRYSNTQNKWLMFFK